MLKRISVAFLVSMVAMVVATTAPFAQQRPAPANPAPIRLKATTFSPARGEVPAVRADLMLPGYAPGQRGYYLVQFDGPILDAWKAQVTAIGGEILEYVPDFVFKVRMNPAQANRVENLQAVIWIGLFHPGYKLGPELARNGARAYTVRIERGADAVAAAAAVAATGAQILQREGSLLTVSADADQLDAIARVLDVAAVENFLPRQKQNEYGGGAIMGAGLANANGFTGSTQTIAIADTGLGNGTPSNAHVDIPANRITAIFNWPGAAGGCFSGITNDGAVDVDSGHGTHTTTSALGGGGPGGEGRGTAPAAHLVFQAVENWATTSSFCKAFYGLPNGYYLVGIPTDLRQLFQQGYTAGARIYSNSWGSNAAGAYTIDSANADDFVWNHRDLTMAFSAGNAGTDANGDGVIDWGSIGSPATAKNVISVGASENDRQSHWNCDSALSYTTCAAQGGQNSIFTYGAAWPASYPANPIKNDPSAGNQEQMAAFSSRGPASDGRIKPDLVAPGTWVLSGYSDKFQQQYDPAPNPQNGLYQYGGWGFPFNQYYKYMGGTSMSAPLVAGAAAVVRDYYQITSEHGASAALVKATLVNAAVDLLDENNDGFNDNAYPIPNSAEGWGRVDLAGATSGARQFVEHTTGLSTNGAATYTFSIGSSGSPFKATLAWTDFPSSTSASKNLVNDLDLKVTAPNGTTAYLGNAFAGGWSQTGGAADRTNNLENVYVAFPSPGTWTVEVRGFNVPNGPQAFALVVDGAFGTPPPPSPPVAPDNLVVSASSSSRIDLNWADNSSTEDGFEIERCEGTGCLDFVKVAQVGSNSAGYGDTGLSPITTYQYRVRAINGSGASGYSNTAGATTSAPPPPPPAAPSGLSAIQASSSQISLSWTDNATSEDSFEIERCQGAGCFNFSRLALVAADVVGYGDAGLAGNTYRYRVRAINAGGASGYSNEASATLEAVPPAPTGLMATPGNAQITLNWTAAAGATTYTIRRGPSTGGPYPTTVATGITGTTYTDTGLTNGISYAYIATAVNAAGESALSNEAATTPYAPVPAKPTGLTATPGNAQITLNWTAAAGATTYTIRRGPSTGGPYPTTVATGVTGTTYTDTGLTNGISYAYIATAVNAAGESAPSNEAATTPYAAVPARPSNLTATPGNGQITLNWTASAGATSYTIRRGPSTGGPYPTTVATGITGTTYIDTGLTNGISYAYIATAVNTDGESAPSNEAAATPLVSASPPPSPGGLTATPGNAQITLNWTASAGATSYTIRRGPGTGGPYPTTVATGISGTTYIDTGLTNGTSYAYVATAVNAAGESAPSNEAAATPLVSASPPPSPGGLTATPGNAQITLNWTASAGATTYTVRRGPSTGGPYPTTVATGVTGTTYTDTGLTNGISYAYIVTAVNAAGESAPSNEAAATPYAPVPPKPTGLTATPGNAQITLNWTAAAGAISYTIRRGPSTGGPYPTTVATGIPGTTYTDTGLTNGISYAYIVTAVNAAGESAPSNEAATTPYAPVPAKPTGLTATPGNAQITLNWTAAAGATTYTVRRGPSTGGPYPTTVATGVTGTTCTDMGLTNGISYAYIVTAVNAAGESAPSNEAAAIPRALPPAPPTGLTAMPGPGAKKISLSWISSTGATGYNVKRSTADGGPYTIISVGSGSTSYADTGLQSGRTYYYAVSAVGPGGESINSAQASASTR